MYQGNGVTTEFPLPPGADGHTVGLVPPGGAVIKLKEGEAYTVRDRTVYFFTPPPNGTTVTFEAPETAVRSAGETKSVCTVLYPDGTMREVARDPWELLEAAAREREEAKREREALRALLAKEGAEVRVLATEAKEALHSRLLNYDARAESAIAAAVEATKEDTATAVNRVLLEIRNKHKQVLSAGEDVRAALERAEAAAENGANLAVRAAEEEMTCRCAETREAWERIRALKPELEELAGEAKAAASEVGRELTRAFTARSEAILDELKGLRGRLENDIERERERQVRGGGAELEAMTRVRDETIRAVQRMDAIEAECRALLGRVSAAEERVREFAERVAAFESAWNARIIQEMEARRMKEAQDG